jgi:hypothetical protein
VNYQTVDGVITVQGWFLAAGDLWMNHVPADVTVNSPMLIPDGSASFIIKEVIHPVPRRAAPWCLPNLAGAMSVVQQTHGRPALLILMRSKRKFDSGGGRDNINHDGSAAGCTSRAVGSGLGKPGPDFFCLGLEQHEIARYVTEFLDDHRFAKYADIVCRSAISNSADVACRVAQNLRLQCRVHRVRTFDSVSGHDIAPFTNKGQHHEIAPHHCA